MAGLLLAASMLPTLGGAWAQAHSEGPLEGPFFGGASGDAALHAVCTAQGIKWLDDAGREIEPPSSTASLLDHCPMCLIGHLCGAPAPDRARLLVTEPERMSMPPAWLHAPHTAAVWRRAHSRAPPLLG